MAIVRISLPVRESWVPDDVARLIVGSEGAVDLASSSPAGGTVAVERRLGELADDPDAETVVLEHAYKPDDKCAILIVGGDVTDKPGNDSADVQTFVQLNDTPLGASGFGLAATANTGEALLTWTPSPDVDPGL